MVYSNMQSPCNGMNGKRVSIWQLYANTQMMQ
uniref:Uncharacterized protein n=1 Tax=Anguilla anguilla TaxID=7936 RepID=A0A0E9QGI9_ANGAN